MKLTHLENLLVEHLRAIGYRGDIEAWNFTEDIVVEGIKKEQKSGVISSLIQKGVVDYDNHPTAPAIKLAELED